MKGIIYDDGIKSLGRRCMTTLATVVLLSLGAGCDPCLNNPCDDGLACNGIETCTTNGGSVECGDGVPIECTAPKTCLEPGGCNQSCTTDEECEDGDPCTSDTCDAATSECINVPDCSAIACSCDDGDACTVDACNQSTGDCDNTPVECPTGQTCDSTTGQCAGGGTGTATTLLGAVGTYSGSNICGDDDDQVTLTDNGGTLTLSGFQGNNDITFTLVNDTTSTATGVVAFGTPGHMLTLTLDPATGYISFDLSVAGTCASDLMPPPQ